ncbi:MAG: DUF1015 domain-containing protein [Putridiphycobacter sp.]|nr:DUF1015 domain-containing protein [Putridiphycobacter sp.]
MTNILPFKAIRPVRDKAQLVASRPYYAYSKRMLEAKLKGNPYTFIHIINPEFHKKDRTKPNSVGRFVKVRERFNEFFNQGIFIQEDTESFYIYRQTTETHEFLGYIGGADLTEYETGKIKKHEETITKREKTFSKYLDTVRFNAEPVLLFHKNQADLDTILLNVTQTRPEYEYTTTDKIKHELWVVSDPETIAAIQAGFLKIDETYIADGHHRFASSYRYYQNCKTKTNLNQHALAFYISESRLNILDFNRVVKDLNGLSKKDFFKQLEKSFTVREINQKHYAPQKHGEISLYIDKNWYSLELIDGLVDMDHPVRCLDTNILTELVLKPILDIHDLKTDDRIDFISGDKGMKGLRKMVDKGTAKLAFALFPISPQQLIAVADANLIMPPKSTWIEPKLRSGLTIYPLDE